MKFAQLVVLLPCHSLEDFPVHHEDSLADGLLAGWSALWHPALLADAEAVPQWRRAEDPPTEPAGHLIVVPEATRDWMPCGWIDEAREAGAVVLENLSRREEILQAALARLDPPAAPLDPELAADFLALGFAYLQVELLTRQMRYSSYVDEAYLAEKAVAAAKAAVAGDAAGADGLLAACFDTLGQARDHFYPVDSYLVDLLLVAPTTLGPALRDELADDAPVNLLLSGEMVEMIAQREPETLAAIQSRLEQGTLSIVGGEYRERETPLLPREEVLGEFLRGREVYEQHLGRAPEVYGRRRFGLSPILPQILHNLGFRGAVHATFDGGRVPEAPQVRASWEGDDGSAIEAVSRPPLDAARSETFLALSQRLGDTLDMDQVATLLFARWPGAASPWHRDLRRVARFGPLLGRFVTLDEYFSDTYPAESSTRFSPDEYRSTYLASAVEGGEPNPLSRHRAPHEEHALQAAAETVAAMSTLVGGHEPVALARESAASLDHQGADAPRSPELNAAVQTFAECLAPPTNHQSPTTGYLLVNPSASRRRAGVELPELPAPPVVSDHVRVVGARGETPQAVVDLPSLGFAWIGPGESGANPPAPKKPLAEENLLRNEHFEVAVNPVTGSIHAIRSYTRRGNLLAQQLAYRGPTALSWRPGDAANEPDSVMAADAVEVTAATAAMGEIVSRGWLLSLEGAAPLARFEQKMRLWRGSRVLLLDIKLEPQVEPGSHPWTSYYASRFAWSDSTADLYRGVGGGSHPTAARRIEAPHFLELRDGEHRLTIFGGGLPFHKRTGDRIVETLLRVQGESATRFRLGIGVGVAHPTQAALDLLLPADQLAVPAARPAAGPLGWLFHVSAPNVVATHWEPLLTDGRATGFRVRLLETEGRAGRVALNVWRDVSQAMRTDYRGQPLGELPLERGKIMIDIARREWAQVEARWTSENG